MDDLTKHRLRTAEEKLVSAKVLMNAGQSRHAGVIAYFQKEFIKTGTFDVKFSKYIQQAFQIRNSCDYDDFFIASKTDAEEQYARAEELLEAVKAYLTDKV